MVGHAISPFWRRSCCLGKLAPDRRCIHYQASLSPPADVGGFMDDLGEAVANSLVQLSISLFVAVLPLVGETPRPCELLLLRPCQVECCRVAFSIPPPFVMTGREQLHNWRVSEQLRTATYAKAKPQLRLPARGWIHAYLRYTQQFAQLVIFSPWDGDNRLLRPQGRLPVLQLLHAFHQGAQRLVAKLRDFLDVAG